MDKLIEQINALKTACNAINDKQVAIEAEAEKNNGLMTEAQRTEYVALNEEYDAKKAELAQAESDLAIQQARKARAPISTANPRKVDAHTMAPLPKGNDGASADDGVRIPRGVKRVGNPRNFRGTVNGRSAEERAFLFGNFLLAKAAIDMPNRFNFQQAVDFARDRWGLSTESGGDMGSFLVPEEFGTDLIDLREQYGVARQVLKRRPMSSDTRTDPRRAGGLTATFVGEGAAGTESTKEWGQVRLTAKKLMVISRYTNELNMDAVISIGDDLAGEIAYAFAKKEDECAFIGDGSSTYGGIMGISTALKALVGATTTSAGGIQVGTGNLMSELTLADHNGVLARLPKYAYTPNTCWVTSSTYYYGVMQKLALAAGGVTSVEIVNGVPQEKFLGFPVKLSQVMPATDANSQVVATFGDHSLAASFGDRQMDSVSFSEHATVGSQSLWERDEIGIKGTERFDINAHDLGTATVAGPVVGLQTLNA